jgi:hypothetical protein
MGTLVPDSDVVRAMLGAAGLDVPDAEVAILVERLPMFAAMIELLHGVEAATDEDMSLTFEAEPPFDTWQ